MNQEVENKNLENSKKRLKVYYSLLVSVLCFIGVSFAFFQLFLRQTDNNGISALNCFSSTLTEETSAIDLTDEFPITDENGMKKIPFTFKVTNNCDNYVKIYITMDSLKEGQTGYIQSKYMKANVSTKGTTDGTSLIIGNQNTKVLENKNNGYILKEVGLNSKESKEFDLRLWIDYDTTKEQAAGMTYTSQVVIVTEPGIDNTLAGTILRNNEVKTPLTTPGKEVSAHTKDDVESQTASVSSTYQAYYFTYGTGYEANGTKFNLTGASVTSDTYANSYSSLVGKYLVSSSASSNGSSTAGTMKTMTNLSSVYYVVSATSSSYTYKTISSNKNTTEALLASTEDDYGTSYYFRGAVKNNYVEFANKCWRIVRVGGDGSVKLVLHNDNIAGATNPCSSANNSTNAAFARYNTQYASAFNSSYNDNAYVGFKYGTAGASDYATTHANTNNSTILTNLEIWYTNNLKTYADAIADTVWCNDKTNVTDTTFNPNGYSNVNGLGYAKNVTYYGATQRLLSSSGSAGGTGPSLKCNGELSKIKSKIGLITADEIAFSGSIAFTYNRSTYLQENTGANWWWSLSPNYFFGGGASVWNVVSGYLNGIDFVNYDRGVRPAISLVSDIEISGGSGTSEDPYVVNR